MEHLLEENSCLWDVSNKDCYLRKKRERAYKQTEEKLGTERAVINLIKAKITTLRQQCWQLLRSFACTTQQVPACPNNSQNCWAQQCCDLLRPFTWALRSLRSLRMSEINFPPTRSDFVAACREHPTLANFLSAIKYRYSPDKKSASVRWARLQ